MLEGCIDCGRPVYAKGRCSKHYRKNLYQMKRKGTARKNRFCTEVELEILQAINRNFGSIGIAKLSHLVSVPCQVLRRKYLSDLESKKMVVKEESKKKVKHGKQRKLLSSDPRMIRRRVFKITEKGKLFLKKEDEQLIAPNQVNRPGFLFFQLLRLISANKG